MLNIFTFERTSYRHFESESSHSAENFVLGDTKSTRVTEKHETFISLYFLFIIVIIIIIIYTFYFYVCTAEVIC